MLEREDEKDALTDGAGESVALTLLVRVAVLDAVVVAAGDDVLEVEGDGSGGPYTARFPAPEIPPAIEKAPPMYTLPRHVANANTLSHVLEFELIPLLPPLPSSGCHVEPVQRAMLAALFPPALVKLPPTYTSVPRTTMAYASLSKPLLEPLPSAAQPLLLPLASQHAILLALIDEPADPAKSNEPAA